MRKTIAVIAAASIIAGIHVSAAQAENTFYAMDIQTPAEWGLDRIDGAVDGSYSYTSSGSNSRIYIVDTGVDAAHPDFGSRVLDGYDAFNQNLDQSDCQGHGTHVAGIVAGSKYGVAKESLIIPVRVLNCSGQGNTSTLTSGIDWILNNHPSGSIGIVNMSLGGPKDISVNLAVSRLIRAGLVVVAAAGNSSVDSCTFSPASADGVIAVGAINSQNYRSPFSNWGDCVDIFAPGSKINSNVPGNYSAVSQKSGTSQAAAFVSGVIATYVSAGLINLPSDVPSVIDLAAEKNVVIDSKSTNNKLISIFKSSTSSPTLPVVTPAPIPTESGVAKDTSISAPKNFTIKYNQLYWSRPVYSGSYSKVSYVVQQYLNGSWVSIGTTKNLYFALPRGSSSNTSLYRVAARTPIGIGDYTRELCNTGASAANLITPITETDTEPATGSIVVSQRGGQGSSVGDVSWSPVSGAKSYEVELSVVGSDSWQLIRVTSGTSIKFTVKPGILVKLRVSTANTDGSKYVVGQTPYLGK